MRMSPQERLVRTTRTLLAARENCAHWDNEEEPCNTHDCCCELLVAIDAHRAARAAYAKTLDANQR